jgi:hypothetical protein
MEEVSGLPHQVSALEVHSLTNGHLGEQWDDIDADEDVQRASPNSNDCVDELHWIPHMVWRIPQVSSKQAAQMVD